ncbi:hypothetical protein MXB_2247 [Myxobolus squamalis]|nr:hypothetical protein MXB_2247 [Myxobolus squamalis]
MNRIKLGA